MNTHQVLHEPFDLRPGGLSLVLCAASRRHRGRSEARRRHFRWLPHRTRRRLGGGTDDEELLSRRGGGPRGVEVVDEEDALEAAEGDVGGVEGVKVEPLDGLRVRLAPHLNGFN